SLAVTCDRLLPRTPSVITGGCWRRRSRFGTRPVRRSSTSAFCMSSASPYGTTPSRRTSRAPASDVVSGRHASAVVGVKLLQLFLHVGHELIGDRTVNEPMVVTEREERHRPDADGIVDDDGAFLDRADAKNGHLRLVDDRHAELRA